MISVHNLPIHKAFLVIGLWWLVLLGGLFGLKQYTLLTGEVVLLRTIPIDPRDLFRGDYVRLNYEISRIPISLLSAHSLDIQSSYGKKIYVLLDVQNGYATAKSATLTPPENGLFIQGLIRGNLGFRTKDELEILQIEYGIENYFIEEGTGRSLERAPEGSLDAEVLIDSSGQAVLNNLILNGQRIN